MVFIDSIRLLKNKTVSLIIIFTTMVLFLSCSEPTPKRDQIPILKKKLLNLQEAVLNKNTAAVDSLLSTKILDNQQNSDSLLKFVYKEGGDFAFLQFGNAEIFYTNSIAQVKCFIMDSASQTDRPFQLNFIFEHDMWLLESFE